MLWPLEPLLDIIGGSRDQACKKLGLSGDSRKRCERDGLTERRADELAIRAGFHPWEVWPAMGTLAMAEVA